MWLWFAKLGSPKWFYDVSDRWLPWLIGAMALFMVVGVIWALLFLPPDYQQGLTTRILVIHVAVAGTSLAFFPLMAVAGTITLVWKMKLADMVAKNAAALGAWFSFVTLATGSIWGSVMWGTSSKQLPAQLAPSPTCPQTAQVRQGISSAWHIRTTRPWSWQWLFPLS